MYDLIIIGGGPAGLAAAIYAIRFKINILVVASLPGGTISEAPIVENYPGILKCSGMELIDTWIKQAETLGVKIKGEEIRSIKKEKDHFILNEDHKTKYILFANGTKERNLEIPGEKEFKGKGVSYCAVCDAPFFANKTVGVVGGSNSAVADALMLSEHCSKVYIIYRGKALRAEPIRVEQIENNEKIEIIYNTEIKEIKGETMINSIVFKDDKELKLEGLFVQIGSDPLSVLAEELGVELDKENYIIVDNKQKTNVDNVYAAGDITTASNKVRQVATAAAEGVIAAVSIYEENKK